MSVFLKQKLVSLLTRLFLNSYRSTQIFFNMYIYVKTEMYFILIHYVWEALKALVIEKDYLFYLPKID